MAREGEPLPEEVEDRAREVVQLLRQLSIGLSAYRLFPGNLDQPGLVAAARRIDAAANHVLAGGPFDGEVTSETFVTADGPLAADEAIERLAYACYERRVERIRIRSAPSTEDLSALYEVLNRPAEEVFEDGGAHALLRRAGVVWIALRELIPHAIQTVVDPDTGERDEPVPPLGDLRVPDEVVARLGTNSIELAESLFDRFQAVVGALPPEMRSSLDLYRALRTKIEALPDEQRRILHAVLLDRVMGNPFAERYIGTMSDTELARVLVEVAERFDRDPGEMAGRLMAMRLRSDDLEILTRALAAGQVEGGTVLASGPAATELGDSVTSTAYPAGGDEVEDRVVYETVGDLIGRSLLAREQEDMSMLRRGFPLEAADQRETAGNAVRDYLRFEQDLDRLDRVLAAWMRTARAAIRAVDVEALQSAIGVLERPRTEAAGEPERSALFDMYREQTPDPELLRHLVEAAKDPADLAAIVEVLAPLGAASLNALLDLLGHEPEAHVRGVILALATELGRDLPDVVVRRIADRDAAVARDAVLVAYRAGGADALPALEAACRHPSPEVREESARGLIAVAGARGVARLRELARDPDERVRSLAVGGLGGLVVPGAVDALVDVAAASSIDVGTRRRAVDQLARHPSSEARRRLKAMTTRKGLPKLPRPLRRYAKGQMKR